LKFEQAGKTLDREIAKLAAFVDEQVKPATRQDLARVLRKASRRLAKLAKDLDPPKR
jgi:hypothetical protein